MLTICLVRSRYYILESQVLPRIFVRFLVKILVGIVSHYAVLFLQSCNSIGLFHDWPSRAVGSKPLLQYGSRGAMLYGAMHICFVMYNICFALQHMLALTCRSGDEMVTQNQCDRVLGLSSPAVTLA